MSLIKYAILPGLLSESHATKQNVLYHNMLVGKWYEFIQNFSYPKFIYAL